MLLKNAQIYTMEEEQVIKGDILIQNGANCGNRACENGR